MLKLQANNELHRDNRPCQLLLKSRTTRLKQLSPSSKSTAPTLHLSLNRKNIISTTITSINLLTSSLKTFSVPHHHAAVSGIEWFHDIGIFTTIGGDNKLKIWDTSTLQMAHEFKLLFPLDKHSWSESGLIAAGGKTASITILDPNIGAASHTLHGHSLGVRSLSWSPIVDHILASGGDDGIIRIWDIRKSFPCIIQYKHVNTNDDYKSGKDKLPLPLKGVTFTSDGITLISTDDKSVKSWTDITTCQRDIKFPSIENTRNSVVNFSILPIFANTPSLLLYPSQKNIMMYDCNNGSIFKILEGHLGVVRSVVCDNSDIYSAGEDGIIRWEPGAAVPSTPEWADSD